MSKKRKMTPEQKEALLARLNKGKGKKSPEKDAERIANMDKPKPKPKTERKPALDPDPENKYPKVEIGHWNKNRQKLNKLTTDAFNLKHKDVEKGEMRAKNDGGNVERIPNAQADQRPTHSPD